jgi:hypothetical protein
MQLTAVEQKLIAILRELPPYGKIEISTDKLGKYDTFLVHKSEKIILSPSQ